MIRWLSEARDEMFAPGRFPDGVDSVKLEFGKTGWVHTTMNEDERNTYQFFERTEPKK